jgi:hypothetical protein
MSIQDAFSALADSPLANMIAAQVHLQELEYTNAIRVAESGLELVRRYETNTARELPEYVEIVSTPEHTVTDSINSECARPLTLFWLCPSYIYSLPSTTLAPFIS